MKRLLGLMGLTCLVVLTACFYLEAMASVVIASVSVVAFTATMFIKKLREKKTLPVMFLVAFFAVSMFMGYTHLYVNPLKSAYDTKTLSVKGIRTSDSYNYNGYYYYKLRCTEIGGRPANCKLLLHSKDAVLSDIGDELQFSAQIDFDKNNIAPSERIFLSSWIPRGHEVKVTKAEKRNLNYHISSIRQSLNRALYLEIDYDTASFSSAVLLGNKHALSPQVKGLLRNTGLSHIAVVSGLHLSVMGILITKALRKVVKNKYVYSSFSIVGVTFFAVISGMGVSVIRALVMFIIFTVGTMIGRKSDSVNSIGAAALLLTLPNPYAVGDVGMLLSFSATLGIVLWSGKVSSFFIQKIEKVAIFTRFKRVHKLLKGAAGSFACSLCATLWTIPISILVFKGFSLVSLVANLVVVPFIPGVLLCIGLCIITHFIGFLSVLTDVLAYIVSFFYDYLMTLCSALSDLPFAYINTTKPYFVIWIIVTAVLVLIAYVIRKRFVRVLAVLLSALFLFSASAVYRYLHRDTLILHVPYTGSGVSVVLESSDGYAVLSAYGTASRYNNVSKVIESANSIGNNTLIALPGFNSDIYSKNLVNEFDYSTVLRYDIGKTEDEEPLCDLQINFDEAHYVNLWDKANISLVPCKGKVFVYIKAGESTVLIVPRNSDCSTLSEEYLSADVVITQGNVNNSELLSFDTLIAPGDGKYDDESMISLISDAEYVLRGNDITYNFDLK